MTKGNVCDFDFYVMNFNGGHAKLPTDTPDKMHLTLPQALAEFKRQTAINPQNYTTAIGVEYSTSRRDLEPHGAGACDLAHFKGGQIRVLDDYKRDAVIAQDSLIRVNSLNRVTELCQELSAQERSTTMAEHNTTFEVSSITKLEDAGSVKALANVIINGEIAVNGVKVVEGKDGLFASMPTKNIGGEYVQIAHPITAEAHQQLNEAVVSSYERLEASGERTMKNDLGLDKAKPVTSQIDVSLRPAKWPENLVASGQVKIDDCFVIKGVKVIKPADKPAFTACVRAVPPTGGISDEVRKGWT